MTRYHEAFGGEAIGSFLPNPAPVAEQDRVGDRVASLVMTRLRLVAVVVFAVCAFPVVAAASARTSNIRRAYSIATVICYVLIPPAMAAGACR